MTARLQPTCRHQVPPRGGRGVALTVRPSQSGRETEAKFAERWASCFCKGINVRSWRSAGFGRLRLIDDFRSNCPRSNVRQ